MKPYDKDIDIVFSPMSDETMSWLDELLTTCKKIEKTENALVWENHSITRVRLIF